MAHPVLTQRSKSKGKGSNGENITRSLRDEEGDLDELDAGEVEGDRPRVGVCFSGGGLRAAAFCSGVLEELLDFNNGRPVDGGRPTAVFHRLSTVSGGGYIGSSFLDWMLNKGGGWSQVNTWKARYFEHVKQNFSLYLNCRRQGGLRAWLQAMVDLAVVTGVLFVSLILMPVLQCVSVIVLTCLTMEWFVGDVLRELNSDCDENLFEGHSPNSANMSVAQVVRAMRMQGCFMSPDELDFEGMLILVVIIFGFLIKGISSQVLPWVYEQGTDPRKISRSRRLLRLFGVVFFPLIQTCLIFILYHAMLAFLALLFEDFASLLRVDNRLHVAAVTIQTVVMLAMGMVWVAMPLSPFRDRLSTAVLIAIMGGVVQGWIFRGQENHVVRQVFHFSSYGAAFTLLTMPLMGFLKFHLLYFYNRYGKWIP